MNPRWIQRTTFLVTFLGTIAIVALFVDREPGIELTESEPIPFVSASESAIADVRGVRTTVIASEASAEDALPESSFDRERFATALAAVRASTRAQRERFLHDKTAFLSSDLIHSLLAAGDGPEAVTAALEVLRSETDPLAQAVLLQYLGLHEADPRVLEPLENAVRGLLADRSRPVQAQLAVCGLLAAMGRQGHPPGALIRQVAQQTEDATILRDLWFGLCDHGFDYAANREILLEGLTNDAALARFGASESLRMFALDGKLSKEEFVAVFEPFVLRETDRKNRLLFLETLAAVGGEVAAPVLRRLAADPAIDDEARRLAATTYVVHADPTEALAFCTGLLEVGASGCDVRMALAGLGSIAAPEASSALAEVYAQSTNPEIKRMALAALSGKAGASLAPFLDAGQSDDPTLRNLAAAEFVSRDTSDLSPEDQERVRGWQTDRARNDSDPNVRSTAVMGALLEGDAAALELVHERMVQDESPQVRGTAATALYLRSWARGDATEQARLRSVLAGQSGLAGSQILSNCLSIESLSPAEVRSSLEQQKRFVEFIASVNPTNSGGKDVFGMEGRMLTRLLETLAP